MNRSRVDPTLREIFWAFLRIGLTAFGGSTQAWAYRYVVERRHWLSERQFIAGFGVAQVLPGSNPLNLALYIGMQLRGGLGAVVAAVAMVLPAFCVILMIGYAYRQYGAVPNAHLLLGGVAGVGIGATVAVGAKLARKLPSDPLQWLIAAAIFAAIGLLRWPLIPIVLVTVPASVLLSYFFSRPGK